MASLKRVPLRIVGRKKPEAHSQRYAYDLSCGLIRRSNGIDKDL
jgi:hypothetical protein